MIEDILEQEALIIGSLLVSPERFSDCDLQPSDFSSYEHKQYFEAMLICLAKNNLTAFSAREVFRAETGATMDCMLDYSGRGMHVGKTQFDIYVERIKKESHKNKALRIASQLIDNLNTGNVDSIGEAISDFMSINKADEKYDHSFDEVSEYVVNAFERAQNGSTGAVKTGFSEMDRILGGWHPGDLIIIAARPAMGKTAFMVNSFLRANTKVGVISAEQGSEQIGVRSVCIEGGVNHQNFRRAEMDDDEFARFKKGLAEFQMMNGRMFDKPAPTILDVEKVARQWVHKYGIGALYVDYAQRLGHENKRMNRIEQNSDIAKRLKELARSLNIPVIALAQVNRACESRTDKRPHMGDIADASAYEKEADVIMTLYRDEVYNEDSPDKGIVESILEKNRHGQTGTARLSWVGQYMQINDFNGYEQSQEREFYKSEGHADSSFAP